MGFPCIVKPVDNQSGRGVSRVAAPAEFPSALARARTRSPSGRLLVESCLAGGEVIVDGFVVDGRAVILGVSDKAPYHDNPTIAARITYPADLPPETLQRLSALNADVLRALGLRTGVFHAEYIVESRRIVPIDVAARGGGCYIYTRVVPHIAGVDANRAMIDFAMGRPVGIGPAEVRRAANIEYLRIPEGVVAAYGGLEDAASVPGVALIHLNARPGERVGGLADKDDRPAYLVVLGDTRDQVLEASSEAKARIRVSLQGGDAPISVA